LLDYAGRTSVSEACRTFGVHRSTFSRRKRPVDRGLEVLRPRERRKPRMSNQLPAMVEQRIVAFAITHPGWDRGGSPPGLAATSGAGSSSRRTVSGAACAGTGSTPVPSASPSSPATAPPTSRPAGARAAHRGLPAERAVGFDCFFVGRLRGTRSAVWQLSAIDCYSSFAWAELVVCRTDNPNAAQTPRLAFARRVASGLKRAAWRLERVLCDNGNESEGEPFRQTATALEAKVTHIRSGRPQTNGHVEALHRLVREADIVYGARKMEAR